VIVAAAAVVAGVALAAALLASARGTTPPPVTTPAPAAAVGAVAPAPASAASVSALLADPAAGIDPDAAYAAVAARWSITYDRRPGESPCEAMRRSGLSCIARRGTWTAVRRYDVPVVLELGAPSDARRYVAVTAMGPGRATVDVGTRREDLALDDIADHWDGGFVVLWRPPRAGVATIGPGANGDDVLWLREQLAAVDGRPVHPLGSPRRYDAVLAERIAAFQRDQGLAVDGVAGGETLARLTTVLDPDAPSLRRTPPPS
jgi:general secretion pathway protein A